MQFIEEYFILTILIVFLGSGVVWLPIFLLLQKAFSSRKKEGIERGIEFTLPDRENSYLRSRLATTLNPDFVGLERKEEALSIGFTQALKTLSKILQAPLSPAERIEAEGMKEALEHYKDRQTFSAKDVREINDAFARLLKLSGKYAV